MPYITIHTGEFSNGAVPMGGFLTCKNVSEEQLNHIELFFNKHYNEDYFLNRYWQHVNLFIRYNFGQTDLKIGELDLIESVLNTKLEVSDEECDSDEDSDC